MNGIAVFIEAIWDLSILPLGDQNHFYAALGFDQSAVFTLVIIATLGATMGCMINGIIGIVIGRQLDKNEQIQARYRQLKSGAADIMYPILLLCWVPLGGFLPLIATALGMPLKRVVPICSLAMLGFYIYQSLNVA